MTMDILRRPWARVTDTTTCALLNLAQWRHRSHAATREKLEAYLEVCEPLTREEFYTAPDLVPLEESPGHLRWPSPHPLGLPANDQASALFFEGPRGWRAPTVLILHALMSVNDIGYRRLALRYNELGWNVALLQLPFHYARRPPVTSTANSPSPPTSSETASEGIRQGVSETRQLMAFLRRRGCGEFGIHGTSYGAWTGALLASLEPDVSFIALLQPIADIEHAIWGSPAGATSAASCGATASTAPSPAATHTSARHCTDSPPQTPAASSSPSAPMTASRRRTAWKPWPPRGTVPASFPAPKGTSATSPRGYFCRSAEMIA